MSDGWDFADPVDILPKLPKNFNELIASKKWQERKEVLEGLLQLLTDNIRLDPQASYNELVHTLAVKILAKDANINVCAIAAKCICQLAKGLRTKFGQHASAVTSIIFEKFKEKKALLRDPLVEAVDAVYASTNMEVICDDVAAALGKQNPNIKIQTNLFLYRVFKTFNAQSAPKKVVKALTPLLAKCTGESDAETREASFQALGAIMKAIGKTNALTMLGDVAGDKTKMAQIEKFYNQAVQEAQEEEAKKADAEPASSNTSDDVVKIQKQYEKVVAERDELKSNLHNLQIQYKKSVAERDEMKSNFHNLQIQYKKSVAERDEMKSNLHNLQIQYKKSVAERDEMKSNLHNLQIQFKKCNEIKSRPSSAVQKAVPENGQTTSKLSSSSRPSSAVQQAVASGSRIPAPR